MSIGRALRCVAAGAGLLCAPLLGAQDTAVLKALDYEAGVPATWEARAPVSSMRLAEYAVRGGAAEVAVFFFGVGQGGDFDANVERWRSQFSASGDGAVFEQISDEPGATFPIAVAEFRGTYSRGVGTGAAGGDARPGHTLVAAVLDTPKGTLFFQLYGPSSDVAAARTGFIGVMRSLK